MFAGSVKAAFSYEIVADDGDREIVTSTSTSTIQLGLLYTAGGAPSVTENADVITFDFSHVLSPSFVASADGTVILSETTDGHLVISIHFDELTSISAITHASGISTIHGDGIGEVIGELTIEAVNSVEAHDGSVTAELGADDAIWSVSANTEPFVGFYNDYLIDLDTVVSAEGSSASVAMKEFVLQLNTTAIPEPTSLSLFGVGAGVLLCRRRRE